MGVGVLPLWLTDTLEGVPRLLVLMWSGVTGVKCLGSNRMSEMLATSLVLLQPWLPSGTTSGGTGGPTPPSSNTSYTEVIRGLPEAT